MAQLNMALQHNNLTVDEIQERISRSKYHQLFRPNVLKIDNESGFLKLQVSI